MTGTWFWWPPCLWCGCSDCCFDRMSCTACVSGLPSSVYLLTQAKKKEKLKRREKNSNPKLQNSWGWGSRDGT